MQIDTTPETPALKVITNLATNVSQVSPVPTNFPPQMGLRTVVDTNTPYYARTHNDDNQIQLCKAKFLESLKQFDDDALVVDSKNKS